VCRAWGSQDPLGLDADAAGLVGAPEGVGSLGRGRRLRIEVLQVVGSKMRR